VDGRQREISVVETRLSIFLGIVFDQSMIRLKVRFMSTELAKMTESVTFRVRSGRNRKSHDHDGQTTCNVRLQSLSLSEIDGRSARL
jgi:hypothetical protein